MCPLHMELWSSENYETEKPVTKQRSSEKLISLII